MFIVHSKQIEFDSQNPTILYGYGGFNEAEQPYFTTTNLMLLHHFRVVLAFANIRGGRSFSFLSNFSRDEYCPFFPSEYGEKWHKEGILANKQNVFDDFHAAAEYLLRKRYTNKKK